MSGFSADSFGFGSQNSQPEQGSNPWGGALVVAAVAGAGVFAFGLCFAFLTALGGVRADSGLPKERVVFFFTANWCPACRHMEPIVYDLKGRGYNIRKVDIDSQEALADKFGVSSIPTFVLLENGYERRREVGAMDGEELAGWLD